MIEFKKILFSILGKEIEKSTMADQLFMANIEIETLKEVSMKKNKFIQSKKFLVFKDMINSMN
jgi:hypothetical protein